MEIEWHDHLWHNRSEGTFAANNEVDEIMGDKFIALRREPRTERAQRAPSEMEDIRAALVERAPREETPERLTDLGLVPVDVCEEAPEVRHSFQKLAYLDAYVVETPSSKIEGQAREVLDEEYMIVPNVELSLPTPTVGRSYARKPQVAGAWPDVSGVKLAHDLGVTGEGVTVCVLDTGVDADHREPVPYTPLRAHETVLDLVFPPLLQNKTTLKKQATL